MKGIGATGFEPATSRSQSERSTGLSHAPTSNRLARQSDFAIQEAPLFHSRRSRSFPNGVYFPPPKARSSLSMKRVLRYSVFIVAVAATPMAALNGSWSPAVSAPSGVGTAALPDRELPKPNYDLAARWTSAKV